MSNWDANRFVTDFGSEYLPADRQSHFGIDYTKGLYSVYDRIRESRPEVMIQLCSSGGARLDMGALKYHGEFWTSDNTNSLDRICIQNSTNVFYPAIATASHVSTSANHQTGMMAPLKFRFDVAMSGRLGLELQPKHLNKEEWTFAQNWWSDGCYFAGYDHVVVTEYAYSDVADGGIWEDGDLRRNESIRYDFSYYGETPNLDCVAWEDLGEDHDELKPHVKKYEDFRTDQHSGVGLNNMWNSGKNIPMLRYADVLLCYAECLNELNRTQDAVDVVNQVRNRAWGFKIPADKKWKTMGKEEFRDKILDERIRELSGENWRRFDLIRTGKFVEYVKLRNKWAKRSGTISDCHVSYPIPNEEIEQNEDMTSADQNEGYR